MLTVVTSLNDKFDSTDKKFSEHITGLNAEADAMYSSTTQSLQVGDGRCGHRFHHLPDWDDQQ